MRIKPPHEQDNQAAAWRVIAHRGASAYAPENTLIAFTKAAQMGVKWIEFDVMQAACGEPVVFHDDELNRTTNGQGELSLYPYDYLKTLDAGAWFNPKFAGERIPALIDVLEFLKNTHLSANIEIKAHEEQAEQLVKRVLTTMNEFLTKYNHRILFSSFSIEILKALRQYAPSSQLGLLLHEWEADWQSIATSLNCVSINVNEEIMTQEAAQSIKQMDKLLFCYTVNQPKRALELFSWGVDGVFSDVPDRILNTISVMTK